MSSRRGAKWWSSRAGKPAAAPAAAPSRMRPGWRPPRRQLSPVAPSVGLVRARAELADLRAEIVAVESRLADADQRTTRATAEVRVQQQALDVLASPNLIRHSSTGVPPAEGARGQALLSLSRGTLVVSASGLPVRRRGASTSCGPSSAACR